MNERIGRYRVLRPLGEGGMGRVFLAESTAAGGFQRRVVLKQVRETGNAELRRALLDEARIQATLVHRNIVPVLDVEEHEGEHFVVLEYIDGLDLRRLMGICGRLPWPLVVYIGMEVAAALDYVHRRTDEQGRLLGLVHRDVTPANILCSWEGEVKLTDFGIAQMGAPQGGIAGNLQYIAPELAGGGTADALADIYSLAVVLYEAITHTSPFRRKEDAATLTAVIAGRCAPISDLLAPVEVRSTITAAMLGDPALRPSSAARLREALLAAPKRIADPVPAFARFLEEARAKSSVDRSGLIKLIEAGRAFTRRVARSVAPDNADTVADAVPTNRGRYVAAAGLALAVAGSAAAAIWWQQRPEGNRAGHGAIDGGLPPAAVAPDLQLVVPRDAAVTAPPPPPVRPVRVARSGSLSINALPWGDLWLDDRPIGHTPRLHLSVPAGRHRVRVRTKNGDERTRVVEVQPGKETKLTVVFADP